MLSSLNLQRRSQIPAFFVFHNQHGVNITFYPISESIELLFACYELAELKRKLIFVAFQHHVEPFSNVFHSSLCVFHNFFGFFPQGVQKK